MSGAGREGFDLFNKFGRKAFWNYLKRGRFQSDMWRDTFGRFACWFLGHDRYNAAMANEPPEYACKRCCHWIK